jgi:elongation factor 2 kinase
MEENCVTEAALRYRYNAKLRTWATDDITVKLQSQSFAHGALRNCYRMKKLSAFVHQNDWKHASNYVAKSYKKTADRRSYFDDVQLQMDAKLWAEEYNKRDPPKKVHNQNGKIRTLIIFLLG